MKIYRLFINILVVIIFLLVLSLSYSKFITKDPIQKVFGYSVLKVATGSMAPALNVNDYIIIKEYNDYNVGDIITAKCDNILITHRIIEKKDDTFITKGDFNNTSDNFYITNSSIEGKVIFSTKFLKLKIFLIVLVFILPYFILRRAKV